MRLRKLFGDTVLGDYIELLALKATFGSFTWSFKLPPGVWWWQWARIDSVVTDANAANRMAALVLASTPAAAGIRVYMYDEGYHTASNTRIHYWTADTHYAAQTTAVVHRMPCNLIVPIGYTPGIVLNGTQAGDTATDARAGFWRIAGSEL